MLARRTPPIQNMGVLPVIMLTRATMIANTIIARAVMLAGVGVFHQRFARCGLGVLLTVVPEFRECVGGTLLAVVGV